MEAAAAMEADAPVDEVDALATRIEEIDELGAGDDATHGNDQWGLGAVLKQLISDMPRRVEASVEVNGGADTVLSKRAVPLQEKISPRWRRRR